MIKRIVLIVVVALLLAIAGFFLPALISPVVAYESKVTINKPREEVWKVFSDEARMKEWIQGLESIELVSGEKMQPGSKYKLIVDSGGEKVEIFETVTEIKEGELYAFEMDVEPFVDNIRVTFEEKDGKTEMVQADSINGKGMLWKAMVFWMQWTFQSSTQGHLERFKNLVEAE